MLTRLHLFKALCWLCVGLVGVSVQSLHAGSLPQSLPNLTFQFAFDIGGQPSQSVIQDKDGFLWFSSFHNGLVRFDGSSIKSYRAGPQSISNDYVTQIFEDKDGYLWVGTNDGLNRYDKSSNTFTVFRQEHL